jgi:hypothetical protein
MPTTLPVRRPPRAGLPQILGALLAVLALTAAIGTVLSRARASAPSVATVPSDRGPPPVADGFGSPYLAWPIPIPP